MDIVTEQYARIRALFMKEAMQNSMPALARPARDWLFLLLCCFAGLVLICFVGIFTYREALYGTREEAYVAPVRPSLDTAALEAALSTYEERALEHERLR